MSDTTVPAENIAVVEENNQPTSPVDEPTTSVEPETDGAAEETQVDESAAEAPESEAERKPTRAERRIRQLSEENRQLRNQPNQLAPSYAQPPELDIQPGQEISPEVYRQHLAQASQATAAQVADQLRQEFNTKEALRNFDADAALVEDKFEELNEKSDRYIPELEEDIAEEFRQKAYRLTGFDPVTNQPIYAVDPSVRLADIAKRKVDLARAIANKSSADMKNAVATQVDESALKPSGAASTNKSFADLSIAEMEAQLGVVRQ